MFQIVIHIRQDSYCMISFRQREEGLYALGYDVEVLEQVNGHNTENDKIYEDAEYPKGTIKEVFGDVQ